MSDPVLIGVISTVGAILAAVLVELVRTRKSVTQVRGEVTSNGGSSMKDQLGRVENKVEKLDERQDTFGERLVRVETLTLDHMNGR